mmetsp:Transcript_47981/g.124598  ORF Transcript_47981/g.124598 Transcript_47981/m.124598 type:complete len:298 (-) Transcript_47981:186-1079(-)|eukprot:CAMPEP_0113878636 /NCGR_PEP_ID=MMETSP0780_2-20120614/6798_1 /TAXON_ID=652834 /ORGANISM="Palpitomonas bilix" /LENGTH=297 /DNA_ID=CAMNT_0000865139 /DNA_START=264 /DNA_END=1157 /DNA_ORIENTATION=- /assembly_acc=CAM_ASM_000599
MTTSAFSRANNLRTRLALLFTLFCIVNAILVYLYFDADNLYMAGGYSAYFAYYIGGFIPVAMKRRKGVKVSSRIFQALVGINAAVLLWGTFVTTTYCPGQTTGGACGFSTLPTVNDEELMPGIGIIGSYIVVMGYANSCFRRLLSALSLPASQPESTVVLMPTKPPEGYLPILDGDGVEVSAIRRIVDVEEGGGRTQDEAVGRSGPSRKVAPVSSEGEEGEREQLESPPMSAADAGTHPAEVRGKVMYGCVKCRKEPTSAVFLPCGHKVMCSGCAEEASECPFCKVKKDSVLKVFRL